jgi:DNA-binding beta-propeller fold protein YncE
MRSQRWRAASLAALGSVVIASLLLIPSAAAGSAAGPPASSPGGADQKPVLVGTCNATGGFDIVYDSAANDLYVMTSTDLLIVSNSCHILANITICFACVNDLSYDPANHWVYVTVGQPFGGHTYASLLAVNGTSVMTIDSLAWYDPYSITYDPSASAMVVTDYMSNNVTFVTGLNVTNVISVGTGSGEYVAKFVSYSPYENLLVLPEGHDIAELNATTGANVTTLVERHGVGSPIYDPTDRHIYVGVQSKTWALNISTGHVTKRIRGGSGPEVYSPTTQAIYVDNFFNATVTVFKHLRVYTTVSIGYASYGMAYDAGNGYVYVAGGGGKLYILS